MQQKPTARLKASKVMQTTANCNEAVIGEDKALKSRCL